MTVAKTLRAIQQWDHWLTHFLGNCLMNAEQQYMPSLLNGRYGKHALLIGTPRQGSLLNFSEMPFHFLLSPLRHHNSTIKFIEGEFYELPLASGSVDLVMLPHTLEHVDNPRQLLAESCRVVKPEGHIIICGFNPISLWGLRKFMSNQKNMPWSSSFIKPGAVKSWLKLHDFELMESHKTLYRPPVTHQKMYERLKFIEWIGSKCFPCFGGVYFLVARAKVVPLTPIKLRWQQKLSGMRLPTTGIPGPTMRKSRNETR